jgi:hypothetical protein
MCYVSQLRFSVLIKNLVLESITLPSFGTVNLAVMRIFRMNDRAISRAVSRRFLIAQARIHAQVSLYEICVDKVALGQVFLRHDTKNKIVSDYVLLG